MGTVGVDVKNGQKNTGLAIAVVQQQYSKRVENDRRCLNRSWPKSL